MVIVWVSFHFHPYFFYSYKKSFLDGRLKLFYRSLWTNEYDVSVEMNVYFDWINCYKILFSITIMINQSPLLEKWQLIEVG